MISEVVIFELGSCTETLVLRSERHVEAPNWMPGDTHLLVNSNGGLFRVPLSGPLLEPVEAEFATKINNDHGVSPDGTRIAISDKTETGKSCIYTIPLGGGTPQRVTEKVPSYFHGWSPDGQRICYPGFRGAGAEIFTCAAAGGPETQVTSGFDHCDGPDYSPDGDWIWFNGERSGVVDLWRVHPDGTGLQRMTFDEAVNWFPHPSPDGKHVLYLAYPPGTKGHPANLDVSLCLMPAQGGVSRKLVSLFGGQGTLNVPCWSSDASRFAFVRYSIE